MKYARLLYCKGWSKPRAVPVWTTKVYSGETQHEALEAAYHGAASEARPDDIETAVVRRCDAAGVPLHP